MEIWEEVYNSIIPVGKYQASVKNGEEAGLSIELESNENCVNINFGVVSALRMLDEGILLGGIFEDSVISKYKKYSFSNTIYKIKNGEFGIFIKRSCKELYEYLDLKHYIIVTMNYVIEVISEWEPSIEVNNK